MAQIEHITKHRLYQTWCNMKTRCYNESSPDYPTWSVDRLFSPARKVTR